jgi:hypothetical protein
LHAPPLLGVALGFIVDRAEAPERHRAQAHNAGSGREEQVSLLLSFRGNCRVFTLHPGPSTRPRGTDDTQNSREDDGGREVLRESLAHASTRFRWKYFSLPS